MRIFTLTAAIIGAMSCLGTTADATAVNLITNGNFSQTCAVSSVSGTVGHLTSPCVAVTANTEFGSVAGNKGITSNPIYWGGQIVNGWTGNNGYMLWMSNSATATTQSAVTQYGSSEMLRTFTIDTNPGAGAHFVALDGDQSSGVQAAISQTITGLMVGMTYKLNFDWGAGQLQSVRGATTDRLQVTFSVSGQTPHVDGSDCTVGGQTQCTAIVTHPNTGDWTAWATQSMTFTAAAATQILTFLSVGTPTGAPPIVTLANVSMYAVPEPMTLALLGSGLAGLVVIRRRKRRV